MDKLDLKAVKRYRKNVIPEHYTDKEAYKIVKDTYGFAFIRAGIAYKELAKAFLRFFGIKGKYNE